MSAPVYRLTPEELAEGQRAIVRQIWRDIADGTWDPVADDISRRGRQEEEPVTRETNPRPGHQRLRRICAEVLAIGVVALVGYVTFQGVAEWLAGRIS